MFDTNDLFNDAIRGASIHAQESENRRGGSLVVFKILLLLLLLSVLYIGFKIYTSMQLEEELIVKKSIITKIQQESESLIKKDLSIDKLSNSRDSDEEYLSALREIESELIEKNEKVNLDSKEQLELSMAITNIVEEVEEEVLADSSDYTRELKKEIGVEEKMEESLVDSSIAYDSSDLKKGRKIIVKKGDTLQGISNKFYGDAMNYKRIIAINDNLSANDTIYEGQTIYLPY